MSRICDPSYYRYKSIYVDENGVLKNKLGIKNEEELNQAERIITTKKLSDLNLHPMKQTFDINHYLAIHKYLFGDIYPFAGQIRDEVIQKEVPFCLPEYVYINLKETLEKAKRKISNIKSRDELMPFIVNLYIDLDMIHPFREGNGRTEREFIRQYMQYICKINGLDDYYIDYSLCDRDEYLKAVIDADTGAEAKLYELFDRIIVNKNELENEKRKTV